MTAFRPAFILGDHGSTDIEMSQLRRGDFVGLSTVPNTPANPAMRVGHIHLKVADLERAIAFYRDVLGLDVMQRAMGGTRAARDRR